MSTSTLRQLWRHPLAKAAIIHLGLLGGGWAVAWAIASALGLSVSVLGLLLAYGVVNIALTGWLLRRRRFAEEEPEADETADALASFAEEPLGAMIVDSKARLARARKGVGRQTAMYQPLDRLVRTTRKIERRLALEPDLRPDFARSLNRHLPLIATTAEQYVQMAGENLSEDQAERLMVAEGVLREAGDRMDALAVSDGKVEGAMIGLIRMDANAEVLAEQLSANPTDASLRASALRASHALRRAARVLEGSQASAVRDAEAWIDALVAQGGSDLEAFVRTDAPALVAAADAVANERSSENEAGLIEMISRMSA